MLTIERTEQIKQVLLVALKKSMGEILQKENEDPRNPLVIAREMGVSEDEIKQWLPQQNDQWKRAIGPFLRKKD